jgi:maleate isomerase
MGSGPRIETTAQTVPLRPVCEVPRLGLILLATDLTTERDVARLIRPEEAGVHATRVAYANPTTPATLRAMAPRLAEASGLLVPGVPLAAICYACTSASVVIGEDAVREAIGRDRPGTPVVTPIGAVKMALAALGVRRIAVLTPYLPETTAPVVAHLAAAGLEVVRAQCLGLDDDREMARVDPEAIVAAAQTADAPEAEALFISCTALPAMGIVARIEGLLGKPVVTSNQACIWRLRQFAGLRTSVSGFGALFAHGPAVAA